MPPQDRESIISDHVNVIGRRCPGEALKPHVEESSGFCGARFPRFQRKVGRNRWVPQLDIEPPSIVCVLTAGCLSGLPSSAFSSGDFESNLEHLRSEAGQFGARCTRQRLATYPSSLNRGPLLSLDASRLPYEDHIRLQPSPNGHASGN